MKIQRTYWLAFWIVFTAFNCNAASGQRNVSQVIDSVILDDPRHLELNKYLYPPLSLRWGELVKIGMAQARPHPAYISLLDDGSWRASEDPDNQQPEQPEYHGHNLNGRPVLLSKDGQGHTSWHYEGPEPGLPDERSLAASLSAYLLQGATIDIPYMEPGYATSNHKPLQASPMLKQLLKLASAGPFRFRRIPYTAYTEAWFYIDKRAHPEFFGRADDVLLFYRTKDGWHYETGLEGFTDPPVSGFAPRIASIVRVGWPRHETVILWSDGSWGTREKPHHNLNRGYVLGATVFTKLPIDFLAREGQRGRFLVHWAAPYAPPLPVEDGHIVVRFPESGHLWTSTPMLEGTGRESFYWVDNEGRRTQVPWTPMGIWSGKWRPAYTEVTAYYSDMGNINVRSDEEIERQIRQKTPVQPTPCISAEEVLHAASPPNPVPRRYTWIGYDLKGNKIQLDIAEDGRKTWSQLEAAEEVPIAVAQEQMNHALERYIQLLTEGRIDEFVKDNSEIGYGQECPDDDEECPEDEHFLAEQYKQETPALIKKLQWLRSHTPALWQEACSPYIRATFPEQDDKSEKPLAWLQSREDRLILEDTGVAPDLAREGPIRQPK
jgi:hypothetical protein